jgi:hypothetical protein
MSVAFVVGYFVFESIQSNFVANGCVCGSIHVGHIVLSGNSMAQRDSLISENNQGRMDWGTCWSFFPIPIRASVCVFFESGSGDPTAGRAFCVRTPKAIDRSSVGIRNHFFDFQHTGVF